VWSSSSGYRSSHSRSSTARRHPSGGKRRLLPLRFLGHVRGRHVGIDRSFGALEPVEEIGQDFVNRLAPLDHSRIQGLLGSAALLANVYSSDTGEGTCHDSVLDL